jgi:hypothetical protein
MAKQTKKKKQSLSLPKKKICKTLVLETYFILSLFIYSSTLS